MPAMRTLALNKGSLMTRQQKRLQVRMLAKRIKELQAQGALRMPPPKKKPMLERVRDFLSGQRS